MNLKQLASTFFYGACSCFQHLVLALISAVAAFKLFKS